MVPEFLLTEGLDPTHQRYVDITHTARVAEGKAQAGMWLRPGEFDSGWGTPTDIPEDGHP